MENKGFDNFEQASLERTENNVTDKMRELNKAFKSSVEPVDGVYGKTEIPISEYKVDNIGELNRSSSYPDFNSHAKNLASDFLNSDGNFIVKTDSYGRPIDNKITDVQLKEGPRENMSSKLYNDSYQDGDQRGHIIADRFGGPASEENVVPQTKDVNTKQFKQVEDTVAKLKNDGHTVDYEVKTNYDSIDPNAKRPSSFEPKIKVDGEDYSKFAKNTEGYKEISSKIYNADDISTTDKVVTNVKETGVKVKPHHDSGMESAAIAATVTCAISTVDNVTACLDGEITADQAAINIAKDTGTAGAVGYGAGFISEAVASSMSSSSNSLISSLGNSCVPAAAVSFGIASYDTVVNYAKGELTTEELAYNLGENAAGVAGSIGGATVAGAALGSVVPGAGTVAGAAVGLVGGMVGYAVASGAYATAVETVGDAIESHSEEIEQLGNKAKSIANETIEKAAVLGENAVNDVKAAISNFNIQNAIPF